MDMELATALLKRLKQNTHYRLLVNKKKNGLYIPDNIKSDDGDSSVALMVADNIDNLECTLSGAGTSNRVNSILVKKQTQVENQAIN